MFCKSGRIKNFSFNFYDKCSDISKIQKNIVCYFQRKKRYLIYWIVCCDKRSVQGIFFEILRNEKKKNFFRNFLCIQRYDKDDRKPFSFQCLSRLITFWCLITSTWIWNILLDNCRSTKKSSQQTFFSPLMCYYLWLRGYILPFFCWKIIQLFFVDATKYLFPSYINICLRMMKKYWFLLFFLHFCTEMNISCILET